MSENKPNQVVEILTCIGQHGPISVQEVVEKTGWNRYVVDLVINRLLEDGWIYQSGVTPDRPVKWQEPVYKAVLIRLQPSSNEVT